MSSVSPFRILEARPAPLLRKKLLLRRRSPDRTQRARRAVQLAFLALNIAIGLQFYLFVRSAETGAPELYPRPAGVEGWLPIAGLMNLKSLLLTGTTPAIHPAAMFLFAAFLAIAILLRKTFCGWLCPVGTLSEYLWQAGRKLFGRNLSVPRWADLALRAPKYLLFAAFAYVVVSMPVGAIAAFLGSPYGMVADVKMLDLIRRMGTMTAILLAAVTVLSVAVENFWCRFLCPYGALLGLGSLFSPVWVKRNPETCIDCGKCRKACPSHLPVDTKLAIHSAECIGCLRCVSVCPAEDTLDLSLIGKRAVARDGRWLAAAMGVIFFGAVVYAKATGHWASPIPDDWYRYLIAHASEFGHPR